MSKKLLYLLAFVLVLGLAAAPAFATDYHIDPVSGSDSSGDGSFGNPWETFANIQYYYSSGDRPPGWIQLQPGDTIYLMNGTHNTSIDAGGGYTNCIARFRTYHGSSGSWFRIAAYPGHSPVIDGGGSNYGIHVFQSSYWEIEGVEVKNCYGRGILISEDTAIKVHDVHIYDTDGVDNNNISGFYLSASTDVEVYDSVFNDNYDRTNADTGGNATENSCNAVVFGGTSGGDWIFHDCQFYQSLPLSDPKSGGGLKCKHASRENDRYFQVYNCTFANHKFWAFQTGTGNTHFHHNLIDGGGNIHSKDGGGVTHQINQTFEYNTHYNTKGMMLNPTDTWVNAEFPDDPKNIQFKNNIVYDNGSYDVFSGIITVGTYMTDEMFNKIEPELFFGNNCYYNPSVACQFNIGAVNGGDRGVLGDVYTLSEWQSTYGYDTNSIEANPLFVDAPNGDFHLQGGSPAAGMGMYGDVPTVTPIFLDNTGGVVDGSTTYDPVTRTTGSGSYTVYNNLASVNTALQGGDLLYIREGEYDNPSEPSGDFNGSLKINVSGTVDQHTVVSAYNGELAVIQAKPGTSNYNPDPGDTSGVLSRDYYPHPAISVNSNYVDVIGLKTYGNVTITSCHDVLIETCDFGGGGPVYNQGPVVELNYNAYYVTIRDSKIHHSCWGENTENGSAIMTYDGSLTVENCEFYDNWGADIFIKDTGQQAGRTVEIRNNFFGYSTINPGNTGVRGHNQDVQIDAINVYNNVFYRKGIGVAPHGDLGQPLYPYNNTFINCGYQGNESGDFGAYTQWQFNSHNNLHYHSQTGQNYYGVQQLGDIEYNLYYSTTGDTSWYVGYTKRADTLSGWQSYSGKDLSSVETDPLFVNASGNRPEDFKRQSYSGDVSGSPYGTVCGAYETGNEIIGLLSGAGPQPPGQASNPSPANSATDISVDADLSWSAGSGATSSDVYFGTDSTPDSGEFQGNQTATTFEPGTMSNNTT
ncbi:MAG: hypothetical protein ACYS1A_07560, partial [Planctomycetota bacterium]